MSIRLCDRPSYGWHSVRDVPPPSAARALARLPLPPGSIDLLHTQRMFPCRNPLSRRSALPTYSRCFYADPKTSDRRPRCRANHSALLLQGRDLISSQRKPAFSKTRAFLLPALPSPGANPGERPWRRVLVRDPTRRLARSQSGARSETFSRPATHETVWWGRRVLPHPERPAGLPHEILVAHPGRLIDHVNARRIDFWCLEMLVLTKPTVCWTWVSLTTLAIANQLPERTPDRVLHRHHDPQ